MHPWLRCYRALESRIQRGDPAVALQHALTAAADFETQGDGDGYARALAEACINRYMLGQYEKALHMLAACPQPARPAARASLAFASYVNLVGQGQLDAAISAGEAGLHALASEPDTDTRIAWTIVLQRNLCPAYHFAGRLTTARAAAELAVQLAEAYRPKSHLYHWALYEYGLLEGRAGRFELALALLRQARRLIEATGCREPLWRWVVAAEGQSLRDMGQLDGAAACYNDAGWGEGDDGPLLLWLLQGRQNEARIATEARLTAALAADSAFEIANLRVMLVLLDLEDGASPATREVLAWAAAEYARLGFRYHRASVLLHLAAVAYQMNDQAAGAAALAEALQFVAETGYRNLNWWHPRRMATLLQRAIAEGIEAATASWLLHERELLNHPLSLSIHCLGSFQLMLNGETLPEARWRGGRAGALRMQRLLLLLARNRAAHAPETIARYVWPDKYEEIDLAPNLHLTLAELRRVLEPGLEHGGDSRYIHTTADGYRLAEGLRVAIDLDEFLALVRQGSCQAGRDDETARNAFNQAIARYRGSFALAKADPIEAASYQQAYAEALGWLAEDALRTEQPQLALEHARTMLRELPLDERATLLSLRACLALGDRRTARRLYGRFIAAVGSASDELRELARRYGL
jgi:DNA-binding SARP family transcriptional activator